MYVVYDHHFEYTVTARQNFMSFLILLGIIQHYAKF